jgi:hypothetical protein
MTQPIELFYDFRSPYSYLAFTQLREMDVDIAFQPMKILTVMEKVGNVPTTITCAAKGRYARGPGPLGAALRRHAQPGEHARGRRRRLLPRSAGGHLLRGR